MSSEIWEGNTKFRLTEGQRMIPTGPSPRMNDNFISSSAANMRSGKQKASVFPEPVNAMPIISRPANLNRCKLSYVVQREALTYAVGIPCSWIGVGELMRFERKNLINGSGTFISCEATEGGVVPGSQIYVP